jgi:hypothetical protein
MAGVNLSRKMSHSGIPGELNDPPVLNTPESKFQPTNMILIGLFVSVGKPGIPK